MAAPGKKFINKSEDVVEEMVQGTLAMSRNLCRIGQYPQHVLARADFAAINSQQVVIISGGGSGHEPAHAGFVGEGMLTGAVLGGVFASPSSSAVLSAIMALSGAPGCLLIVKNYTGDRLNFGIAMEKARAAGIQCEMCIVGDDCALPKDKGITGRRGIAGTLFVHKCAGAAAASGKSLAEVTAEARAAADNVGSMGVALSTCTLPGAAPNARLDGDLVEIGLGIHGEPGASQCKWRPSDELVDEALAAILDPIKGGDNLPYLAAPAGAQVAVLINSLGATPPMELAVLGRRIVHSLTARGLVVTRCCSGALMTSIDMAGFSVSLLLLTPARIGLLDAPTTAPAWPCTHDLTTPLSVVPCPLGASKADKVPKGAAGLEASAAAMLKAGVQALILAEPQLTEWDSVAGDGDCGMTMKRGAERVLQELPSLPAAADGALLALAECVKESMGGTSGVLLEILFTAAARSLAAGKPLGAAVEAGVEAVEFYGGARVGSRTMIDALRPAAAAWKAGQSMAAVAAAAQQGADATKSMAASAGRANWVGESSYQGVPDPGAAAVAIALEAAAKASTA